MTAPSKARRVTAILGAAVALLATTFVAAPAQAAPGLVAAQPPATKVSYVAIGDSYAAGFGGGDYLDDCGTSPNGYAALLASDDGQDLSALRGCIGATTSDVLSQLDGLDERTKSVTLTVGANDLGVGAVAQACLPPTGTPESMACSQALAYASAPETISALMTNLAATLTAVRNAAPRATVYVTGYPLLFETPSPDSPLAPFAPQIAVVNGGIVTLNSVIETVVDQRPGFEYVPVTTAFAGHGIGSIDPWIVAPGALDAFHPNAAGHAAYADAIRSAGFSPSMKRPPVAAARD
ncbi:SGNH/GDSL hydrolase family protein [Agromyces bauzanensis]